MSKPSKPPIYPAHPYKNYKKLKMHFNQLDRHLKLCERCSQETEMILMDDSGFYREMYLSVIFAHARAEGHLPMQVRQQPVIPVEVRQQILDSAKVSQEPEKPLDKAPQDGKADDWLISMMNAPRLENDPMPDIDSMSEEELEAFLQTQRAALTPPTKTSAAKPPTGAKEGNEDA